MRELIIIVLIFLLGFELSCNTKPRSASIISDDDSLVAAMEKRIMEKKKLNEIREQLVKGSIGHSIQKYKPIIKKYSKRYGFDWRLVVAQIIQESGFKEKARSRVGAHGLMQIMPKTASEISQELDIEYIMRNPRENITAGIYHLKKQTAYFPNANYADKTRLALASYNAGVGRVFDAQDIARFYRQPTNKWDAVKPYLSMLKKNDWQLHLQVWPKGQPKYGYFYGYNETINYVDRIWERYSVYRKIM